MKKDTANEWAKLPVMSPEEAAAEGYVAITTKFDFRAEPDVVRGMEQTMGKKDAVWIVRQSGTRRVCELGRRSYELNKLVYEDGRPRPMEWEKEWGEGQYQGRRKKVPAGAGVPSER